MKKQFNSVLPVVLLFIMHFLSSGAAQASCEKGILKFDIWHSEEVRKEFESVKSENAAVADQYFFVDKLLKQMFRQPVNEQMESKESKKILNEFKKASDTNMFAAYYLGLWYQEGLLAYEKPEFNHWSDEKQRRRSIEKGVVYYLKSAKMGFIPSQIWVAYWSLELKDKPSIMYWSRRAAKQGDQEAQKWMAKHYAEEARQQNSSDTKSISEAYFWHLVSKAQTAFDAEFLQQLRQQQVAKIENKVSNWKPVSEVCK